MPEILAQVLVTDVEPLEVAQLLVLVSLDSYP